MSYIYRTSTNTFIGNTLPGTARIRLHDILTNEFVVAFDPDSDSLLTDHPSGVWIDASAALSSEQLDALYPQVVGSARERRLEIRKSNQSR